MPSVPDAISLCGGAGLRLSSVTGDGPKSIARIGGRPFLGLLFAAVAKAWSSGRCLDIGTTERYQSTQSILADVEMDMTASFHGSQS
jgi:hypothetical protein